MTNGRKALALTWLGSISLFGMLAITAANWRWPAADSALVAGVVVFLQSVVSTVVGHLSGASKPDAEKPETGEVA